MDSGRMPWDKRDLGCHENAGLDWKKILAPAKDPGWISWDQCHKVRQTDPAISLNEVEPSGKDAAWNPWGKSHLDSQPDAAVGWKKVDASGKDAAWNPWEKSHLDGQPDAAVGWNKINNSGSGTDPWKKSVLEGEGDATTPWSKVAARGRNARWSPDNRSARCRSPEKRSAGCWNPEKRSARCRSPVKRSARRWSSEKRSSRWSPSPEKRSSRRSRSPERRSSRRSRSPERRSSRRSRSPEKRSSRRSRSPEKRSSRRSRSFEKRSSRRSRSPEKRSSRWSLSPEKRSYRRSRSSEKRSSRRSPEKRSADCSPEKRSTCRSSEKGSDRRFNDDNCSGWTPRKRSLQECQESGATASKKDEDKCVLDSAPRSGSGSRWMPWSESDEERYGGLKIPREKGEKDISWTFSDMSDSEGEADLEISRGKVETLRKKDISWTVSDMSETKGEADLEISRGKVEASAEDNGLSSWEKLFREGLKKRNVNGEKIDHSPPKNQASDSKTAPARLGKNPPMTSSGKGAALMDKVGQAILPSEKFRASTRPPKLVPESATVPSQHVKPPPVISKGKQVVLNHYEKSVRKGQCDVAVLRKIVKVPCVQFRIDPTSICTKVQKRIPEAVSPLSLRNPLNGPALVVTWKGSFEVIDFSEDCRLCEGFRAHPSANLSRKAHEAIKKMDGVLKFKVHRRTAFWPNIFQNDIPDKDDIALYFYPGKIDCSRREYSSLLKLIDQNDLMLRSSLEHVELLIFPSRHLTESCQKLRGSYYMWGVFRSLKGGKKKASSSSNKTKPVPGLPRPTKVGVKNGGGGLKQNVAAQPTIGKNKSMKG